MLPGPRFAGKGLGAEAVVAVRDANQLPLYLCLAGGLVGGLASGIAWLALGFLLWMPYWRQLRDYGMAADDNGWAMGIFFVPPLMGVAFLLSTLMALIIVRWIAHPKPVFIVLNLVPGLWLTVNGLTGILRGRSWDDPGFEVAVLLIGLGWGAALYALARRRSGQIEA
jgi:hypothetical protein